jgi:tRNA(His) 5'-end guanylyltransferase
LRWLKKVGVNERSRLIGHINNLYNTTFWALVQNGGVEAKDAEKELAVSPATAFECWN